MFKFATTIKQKLKTTIMKKSIALVAAAFGVSSAFAQDLTSKKGEPFLPEAGDYAISVDATPFLNYAGNFFGKTANNTAPTFNFFSGNNVISGKYFKDANTAYRVGVNIGLGGNGTVKNNVANRSEVPAASYPSAPGQKENVWKNGKTQFGITAGIEKRKGKTRLQGFYGADLGLWIGSSKDKYTYGNALVATSTSTAAPIVTVDATADAFSGAGNIGGTVANGQIGSSRITERKSGSTIKFGVRGFVGAEYFILPKIAIGGEFGWGLGLSMTGKSKTTSESIGLATGATDNSVGTTTIEGGKTSSFVLGTDNMGGSVFGPSASLRLSFHF